MSGPLNLDAIESYCEFFRRQVADVESVEQEFFRRILLLSMVESLAKSRYSPRLTGGRELGKGESFTQLIIEYGDWPEAAMYSVPQLSYSLADRGLQAGPLYAWTQVQLKTWRSGDYMVLASDGKHQDIAPLVSLPGENAVVESARHYQLLWGYRNNLIHEFREPGYPWSLDHVQVPHYTSMGVPVTTWELSYPIAWLEGLVKLIIESLCTYWSSHDLNPRDAYDFGSVWRRS
jgi:hypothetical protein